MSERLSRRNARSTRIASRARVARPKRNGQAETEDVAPLLDPSAGRPCPLRAALSLKLPPGAPDPATAAESDFREDRNPVKSLQAGVTLHWAKAYLRRRLELVREEHETGVEIRRVRKSLDGLLSRGRLTRGQRQRVEQALEAMPLATYYRVTVAVKQRAPRRWTLSGIRGRRVEVTRKVSVEDAWQELAELVLDDVELAAIILPEELKRNRSNALTMVRSRRAKRRRRTRER
jgi:hypothetical protein